MVLGFVVLAYFLFVVYGIGFGFVVFILMAFFVVY